MTQYGRTREKVHGETSLMKTLKTFKFVSSGCKCNFPLARSVRLSVCWLVRHNFLTEQEVTLPCSFRGICFIFKQTRHNFTNLMFRCLLKDQREVLADMILSSGGMGISNTSPVSLLETAI